MVTDAENAELFAPDALEEINGTRIKPPPVPSTPVTAPAAVPIKML